MSAERIDVRARVTEEMVEAACESYWGEGWDDAEMGAARRIDAREMLIAALAKDAAAAELIEAATWVVSNPTCESYWPDLRAALARVQGGAA